MEPIHFPMKPAPTTTYATPPQSSTREEKRALLEAIEQADANLEEAKQLADKMLLERSNIIEKLNLLCAKKPFIYKGQMVRIVSRKSDFGNRKVYFFRAISKDEPEDID